MQTASVHRWEDLTVDRPMPLISRQRVVADRMMISRVVLEAGFSVPTHHHENEQISVLLSGRVKFTINEGSPHQTVHVVAGGQVIVLPSNLPHAAEAIEESVLLDLFSPPSEKTGIDRH